MFILDKAKIGNSVHINLELTKDRISKEVEEAIKYSSIATITGFRITDGKGIGVILRLSNGQEKWFFENEINLLDEDGNVIKDEIALNEKNNLITNILNDLNYENKIKIRDLLNPANFMVWLIVSFKDIV